MERLVAPHGIEAHPRHAAVCAVVRPNDTHRAKPFVDVLVLPAERAARQCTEHGGYTYEIAGEVGRTGIRLIFASDRPGHMGTVGRGRKLGAKLFACEGGILLPGHPPPVPWEPGEAEAYPFCFLLGVEAAIHHFEGWAKWARREGIDALALRRYVQNIPAAPPLAWFVVEHTEAELQAARFKGWTSAEDGPERWPGQHRLWLFRAEWVHDIPAGMEVVSISGKRLPFVREEHLDADAVRFGALAVGLLAKS